MDDDFGSDAAVITASVADAERFAVLFDRHGPHLHRYLARRLGPDAADDLLAEVFLAAFRRRATYDRDRPDALPWLYGMAGNVVAQHRRVEARRWRLLAALPRGRDEPNPADDADSQVQAQASRRQLALGLAALPGAEREVLLLFAWEQMTYEQIADALDIPVGTVRSRLSRARTRIRTRLGGLDPRADIAFKELLNNE